MFTGLIDDVGELTALREGGAGKILRIATQYELASLKTGASIACSGICLTVTESGEEKTRRWFAVEASIETLSKTTLGVWKTGKRINLERSLKLGDPFGGHLVTGHVDGIASVIAREEMDGSAKFTLSIPRTLARFVAMKGSVALDGVSLTVNDVRDAEFDVMLIPHTMKVTGFGGKRTGDQVNIEVDLIARYLGRLQDMQSPLYRAAG